MAAIDNLEALQRTKRMLVREWDLGEEPASDTSLGDWPAGLGKSSTELRTLEGPIERVDFLDVEADVIGNDLAKAKTVGDLTDKIWDGIPPANRLP
jgi:hypothetical protein